MCRSPPAAHLCQALLKEARKDSATNEHLTQDQPVLYRYNAHLHQLVPEPVSVSPPPG